MKKKILRTLALVLALSILLAVPAFAMVQPRMPALQLSLMFEGTTAYCLVEAYGDYLSDQVEVEVRLLRGSTEVASWSASGSGFAIVDETAEIIQGRLYTLEAVATFNGTSQIPGEVSKSA